MAGILVLLSATVVLVPGSGSGAVREPLRVGLVLSPGLARDDFWYAGLQRAERELGVAGKVLVPSPKEGSTPSFRSLARQGYGLIIAVTADSVSPMERVARQFPKARFAVLDVHSLPPRTPANLWGVGFAEEGARRQPDSSPRRDTDTLTVRE